MKKLSVLSLMTTTALSALVSSKLYGEVTRDPVTSQFAVPLSKDHEKLKHTEINQQHLRIDSLEKML